MVFILYVKDHSYTVYNTIGVYSTSELAEEAWKKFSAGTNIEGKIESVELDRDASHFITRVLRVRSREASTLCHHMNLYSRDDG